MKNNKVNIKNLEELEQLIGKEQVSKLFLEHYLQLTGRSLKNIKDVDINEILGLDD